MEGEGSLKRPREEGVAEEEQEAFPSLPAEPRAIAAEAPVPAPAPALTPAAAVLPEATHDAVRRVLDEPLPVKSEPAEQSQAAPTPESSVKRVGVKLVFKRPTLGAPPGSAATPATAPVTPQPPQPPQQPQHQVSKRQLVSGVAVSRAMAWKGPILLKISSRVVKTSMDERQAAHDAAAREEEQQRAAAARVAVFGQWLAAFESQDVEYIFMHVPTDLEAPGYSTIVQHPVSWTVMRRRMRQYADYAAFADDFVRLVHNALLYNDPSTIYYEEALRMLREGLRVMTEYESWRLFLFCFFCSLTSRQSGAGLGGARAAHRGRYGHGDHGGIAQDQGPAPSCPAARQRGGGGCA